MKTIKHMKSKLFLTLVLSFASLMLFTSCGDSDDDYYPPQIVDVDLNVEFTTLKAGVVVPSVGTFYLLETDKSLGQIYWDITTHTFLAKDGTHKTPRKIDMPKGKYTGKVWVDKYYLWAYESSDVSGKFTAGDFAPSDKKSVEIKKQLK